MFRRLLGRTTRKKPSSVSSSSNSFMNNVPMHMRNNFRKSLFRSYKTLGRLNKRTRRKGRKTGSSYKTLKQNLEERGIRTHYKRPSSRSR